MMKLNLLSVIFSTLLMSVYTKSLINYVIPCEENADCEEMSKLATCVDSTCVCKGDCNDDINTIIVNRIGETCHKLRDCNVRNSYCLNNKCTCKNGTIESKNGKKCLKISSGIGSNCTEDIQCATNVTSSVCKNKSCECEINMHLHENMCIGNRILDETCTVSEECTVEYSDCINSTCSCIKRYVKNYQTCLLAAKSIRSPCSEDIQCEVTLGGGSQCSHGFCDCKEMFQFKSGDKKCTRDMFLGETCGESEDCHQPGSGFSRLECLLGECKCKSMYNEVEGYCLISSTTDLSATLAITLISLIVILANNTL